MGGKFIYGYRSSIAGIDNITLFDIYCIYLIYNI